MFVFELYLGNKFNVFLTNSSHKKDLPNYRLVVLDLLKNHHPRGLLSDAIAVPLNWYFLKLKNRDVRVSPEAKAAMQEHLRTDKYLNLVELKKIYTEFLTTPKIRKHLFWRYSLVWQKPDE